MTALDALAALTDLIRAAVRKGGFTHGTGGKYTLCWACGGYEPEHDAECAVLRALPYTETADIPAMADLAREAALWQTHVCTELNLTLIEEQDADLARKAAAYDELREAATAFVASLRGRPDVQVDAEALDRLAAALDAEVTIGSIQHHESQTVECWCRHCAWWADRHREQGARAERERLTPWIEHNAGCDGPVYPCTCGLAETYPEIGGSLVQSEPDR